MKMITGYIGIGDGEIRIGGKKVIECRGEHHQDIQYVLKIFLRTFLSCINNNK